MQTDPRLHRDAAALADQAEHFASLAPNIIVKIPATQVGIVAIEEATYRGVSINVTVSFTVPQAVEAGAAIQRGLERRQAENKETASMGPVVTIMVGRLDDWMKTVVKRDGIDIDPEYLEWAGVAAFKKAYEVFLERGFQARLLAAAYRNQLQWTELVGGDIVLSPPFGWQEKFQASGHDPEPRIERAGRPGHHRRAADHPRLRARLRGRRHDARRVRRLRRHPHHPAPVPRGRRGPRPDRARRDRSRPLTDQGPAIDDRSTKESTHAMTQTVRLTTAQALVKFLANQYSERDGVEQRLVAGMLGIFGHGNVAGVGQALLQAQVQGEDGSDG